MNGRSASMLYAGFFPSPNTSDSVEAPMCQPTRMFSTTNIRLKHQIKHNRVCISHFAARRLLAICRHCHCKILLPLCSLMKSCKQSNVNMKVPYLLADGTSAEE